jgi:hypothetical protein
VPHAHLVIGGIGHARMREIARSWPGRYKLQKAGRPWSLIHYVTAQERKNDHHHPDAYGRYPGRTSEDGLAGQNYCDNVVAIIQSWNMEALLIATRYGRRMRRRQREHPRYRPLGSGARRLLALSEKAVQVLSVLSVGVLLTKHRNGQSTILEVTAFHAVLARATGNRGARGHHGNAERAAGRIA